MGLCATAKGLTAETEYDCGYLSFAAFRKQLAAAYDPHLGELYEKCIDEDLSDEEIVEWNRICPSGLETFLLHSDCDGKITPAECRAIYSDIKDITLDLEGHNYTVMQSYNVLEHWKAMFLHCAKRRVNLVFR